MTVAVYVKTVIGCIVKAIIFILFGIFLINAFYWGFTEHRLIHLSPYVSNVAEQDNDKFVFIEKEGDGIENYILLTDNLEEIRALNDDLTWTWHTNFKAAPKDEDPYVIYWNHENKTGGGNYIVWYYPKSDVIVFPAFKEKFVSLHSSERLKELFNRIKPKEVL